MSERRKYRAGDVVQHIVLGEEYTLACDEDAYGRVLLDGDWWFSNAVELACTAGPKPRRTLADVAANPPEGWEGYSGPSVVKFKSTLAEVSLNWSAAGLEVLGLLVYGDGLPTKELAATHRAVADLLDVLAEVSDV